MTILVSTICVGSEGGGALTNILEVMHIIKYAAIRVSINKNGFGITQMTIMCKALEADNDRFVIRVVYIGFVTFFNRSA